MKSSPSHSGYVFLITVLSVGAIAATVSISLLLRGWAAEQNGRVIRELSQAYEYASSCIERTIHSLRADVTYTGNQIFAYPTGTCTIHLIGGAGAIDRTVCVEGASGNAIRRFQTNLVSIIPSVVIQEWSEVTDFTLCP